MRTTLPTTHGMQYTSAIIEYALTELGVRHTISEKEAVVHCIFHDDDPDGKPNLYINVDKKCGTYHCFRCGATGRFSDYIQRGTGWTMIKTLQYLVQLRKRTRAMSTNVDAGYTPSKSAESERPEHQLDAFESWHPYLKVRGLTEATALRWSVGYDPEKDAITLPWFDASGNLVAVKRRSIMDKMYRYPSEVDLGKTLFGLHLVRQHSFVWIVEGEFDALLLDQVFRIAHFDKHYVVALGGSALRPTQVQALLRKQPEAIVFFLDNDEPGREALASTRQTVGSSVTSVVAEYPVDCTAKDPGELTFTQILDTALRAESSLK